MGVIVDLNPAAPQNFGDRSMRYGHDLHHRPMFGDEALAALLDAYPRDQLGVFTMGEDPEAWRTWRAGAADGLSGAALLAAAKAGRLWLNLRHIEQHIPAYRELGDEMFAAVDQRVGGHTFKRDVGLLISSPKAQCFYHLDIPLVALWQLRGRKRIYVYPVAAPYARDEDIERIALRETDEQFAFQTEWDAGAEAFDLEAGDMVTWPQNAPHRVVNGDSLNVSLSLEFMTPAADRRARRAISNGFLRRSLGLKPTLAVANPLIDPGKVVLSRAVGRLRRHKAYADLCPVSFKLDPAAPGALLPL